MDDAKRRRHEKAERRRKAKAEKAERDRRLAVITTYRAFVLQAFRGVERTAEQDRELSSAMEVLHVPPFAFARDVQALGSWAAADINARAVLLNDHPRVFDDPEELLRRWQSRLDRCRRVPVPADD